ncbi:Protein of unknown function [Streptomyces zhaozhouensis]|uniref:DUF2000 domain-containing protein n=1 Tax=Streptomyces zhaozhouensis TaxID=1300267 RepID=A0A286DUF3_9ACTN|nr:DUF2000 family protein [Streptomyces zhaozhouensis]SOD62297.1 Protein of unknown function [Streptomyces zhaozhouensis]
MTPQDTGLRTALVVAKHLPPGVVANATAVLMGHLATRRPALYGAERLADLSGNEHATIRDNVVVLTGRPAQVGKLAAAAREEGLLHAVFSDRGRSWSNEFEKYRAEVAGSEAAQLEIIATGVTGPDPAVRALTKKFSYYA